MSTKPGATTSPFIARTFASPGAMSCATFAIDPSSHRTSRTASVFVAGSTTRPPLSKSFMSGPSSREQIEDRHADRDPVGDLIQDDGGGTVGDVARHLDAPVDGPRVHHDRIALRAAKALLGQAELLEVLTDLREEPPLLTLELDAQHHYDVAALQRRVHARGDRHAHPRETEREQRRRARDHDVGAHLLQEVDVRAHHAAVGDVPDDRDAQARETALALTDGEGIEERLCRVLVGAVPGVDDRRAADAREQVWRARLGVADHDEVGGHRLEVLRRIDEALTLHEARRRGREVEGVGRQALLGDLEGAARARRGLDEEVDHRLTAQGGDLLDLPLADLGEALRRVEDEGDLLRLERLDPEQVRTLQVHRPSPAGFFGTRSTASSPSVSFRWTSTDS